MLPVGQISRPSVAVDHFHLDWELQGVGWRGDAFLALNLHPEYWALYWVLKETSATRIHLGHFHRWHSGSVSKESACSAGDLGSIPRSGGSRGEGNGNPPQYFCLGNPMGRGAWQATVHGVPKSWTWQKWLSTHTKSKWVRLEKKLLSVFCHVRQFNWVWFLS